jgi:PHD/YefM family antitoxin component YafN of YafNO toxin-antitoxin module
MPSRSQQYVIDDQGNRTAVLMPIKEYQNLMEDLHDLAIVAERKDEERIGLEEMMKRLVRDGIL